jgi:cytoskeletal protein RodZ
VGKVGEVLRQQRESRSLSLEDVRSALGIPLHYLQAMESGKSRLVADEFYLIPFLRRYAEFLDLDPAVSVAQFLSDAAREESRAGAIKGVDAAQANQWLWIAIGGAVVVIVALWLILDRS